MNRYCFLYNPTANRQRSLAAFQKLKEHTKGWPGVDYRVSENQNHLRKLASEAAKAFNVVVACGGDGTVRDVAVAIRESDAKLGVVPLGSGNDFSKSLGLKGNITEILQILRAGKSRRLDLGKCNNHYFINSLGFGFDGQTNLYAAGSRISQGTLRYFLAALKTACKMETIGARVIVNGQQVAEGEWLMLTVANGRVEGGNFIVAPGASLFDNVFTLLTVRPVSRFLLPFLLPLFLLGRPELSSKVSSREGSHFLIEFDQFVFIHADGEQLVTDETCFKIEVLPGALEVIC